MSQDTQIVCPTIDECRQVSPALIKHFLVPFDQSPISHRAFELALNLAKKHSGWISILSIAHSDALSSSFIDMNVHQKLIEGQKVMQLNLTFKQLADASKRFGVSLKANVIFSDHVADSILSFCSQRKVDMIVMGTRARNGPKRFLIGSVAMDVIQKASCPVILVK